MHSVPAAQHLQQTLLSRPGTACVTLETFAKQTSQESTLSIRA